ncbi:bifunctional hydroxymethylpyrimidine kinase/phosphomethylpyrimidine kinase [Sporosarcina pasteurii]|uniref:pyridoxal kinase n=1 Tax=Sporosarcina pasteurii TaxID=1474 RepID=A0A380BIH4_SPOPA|nr:bifunctional hydroxymethylpyrimidine kinase/phosphomethylpyrimidine kinase [Sporosarcina pasteurii]MDS9470763.1 bifunctional hydroxymethylpyrimidine kinase/phosphomethylpyrimidine kinase [Sporosarcina pasteurii]QBQ05565.1 bifunctional hydroxymethylpyrimidine kinase/phosphomethylpyrimidine kinase [Sporosarcina pasteurii]SUJ01930.1 Pyridoxine kinase [Sporosarcina pasteurii]
MIRRALSIAGSAARGGAGIQADLKTFQELGVFGTTAVTAIVARNPRTGEGIFPQSIDAIEAQVYTVLRDIGADAIKTGMLFTEEIITKTAGWIKESSVKHVVVDPVMIGKIGSVLLKEDAIESMKKELLPLATIITPNMPEAAQLLGASELLTIEDLKLAAKELHGLGPAYVLVKGGRLDGPAVDVLYDGQQFYMFEAPRIDTIHTNGAGCTYSAAITAELAKGSTVPEAVEHAKKFITAAIRHSFGFKQGVGPTFHAAYGMYDETACKTWVEEK